MTSGICTRKLETKAEPQQRASILTGKPFVGNIPLEKELAWVKLKVFETHHRGGISWAQLYRRKGSPDAWTLERCLFILRDAGQIIAVSRRWYLRN